MLSEKEVTLLYETVFSAPGMNDVVKIDWRASRKEILLLAQVIEKGLDIQPGDAIALLVKTAGEDSFGSLRKISAELLGKAGLSGMSDKLQSLQPGSKQK